MNRKIPFGAELVLTPAEEVMTGASNKTNEIFIWISQANALIFGDFVSKIC